jgi:hypothetical protein
MSSRRRVLSVLGFLVFGPYLLSCGGGDGGGGSTGPDPGDAVASVTVSPGSAELEVGGATALSAIVRTGRGEVVVRTVNWSSSAPGVASVTSSGLVTGVSPGTASGLRAQSGADRRGPLAG